MQCLTDMGGSFVLSTPQPTEFTTCLYVLAQPQDLVINAWALTTTQGLQIAAAIGICWATGLAFRLLGQFLNQSSNQGE